MGVQESQYTEPCLVHTGLGSYSTPLTLSPLPCPVAPLHFSFSEKQVAVSSYQERALREAKN